jgi:regulator-associated protein of mTOR
MIMKRPKPPLLKRSKSDYGPRGGEESEESYDNEAPDWGARHGFEGHYASEEYVSQLANVSRTYHFYFDQFVMLYLVYG